MQCIILCCMYMYAVLWHSDKHYQSSIENYYIVVVRNGDYIPKAFDFKNPDDWA